MGGKHGCFPSPIDTIHTLRRRRHLLTRIKNEQVRFSTPADINVNNNNNNSNAINLNTASEDELMMLPGVNRLLAQNILDYRQLSGGFRELNELLRIPGMRKDIFQRIRLDLSITILPPPHSHTDYVKQELINLNIATYDQLSSVPGLTPALIERILRRREHKGAFRFVEDLLKIKGIDYIILAQIRSYITVDQRSLPTSPSESSIIDSSANAIYPTLNRNNNNHTIDSLSLASLLLETLPPELQTILLSSPPQRPTVHSITQEKYLRFASWNLQQLTNEKVQNPGVREVVCRIILEHK